MIKLVLKFINKIIAIIINYDPQIEKDIDKFSPFHKFQDDSRIGHCV